jgi:8-oxo-dGTP pyrophosphatase MutT (NUDIX family)
VRGPRILDRRLAFESPYLDVVEKQVDLGGARGVETFWSVRTGGYTAVIALTDDGLIPLVSQYRPAVEAQVLELPSGTIEDGESPADAARRELLEETGCQCDEVLPLGRLHVDSGRFETQQWAFYASSARVVDVPTGDEELSLRFVSPRDLRGLILGGEFNHAAHVAMVGLAFISGRLPL